MRHVQIIMRCRRRRLVVGAAITRVANRGANGRGGGVSSFPVLHPLSAPSTCGAWHMDILYSMDGRRGATMMTLMRTHNISGLCVYVETRAHRNKNRIERAKDMERGARCRHRRHACWLER